MPRVPSCIATALHLAAMRVWLTLCSHMDAVRAVAFHPSQPLIISGSEDNTVKVWLLDTAKAFALTENASPRHAHSTPQYDVEPIITFRGHTCGACTRVPPNPCVRGAVFAVATGDELCYSAGLDTSIRAAPLRRLAAHWLQDRGLFQAQAPRDTSHTAMRAWPAPS